MSSPAGSKRYIRLNLNMRGERKITVGAGAAFQNSNHLTFSSHLNNKLLSSFHIFKLLGHRKSCHILKTFYGKIIMQLILLIVFYIFDKMVSKLFYYGLLKQGKC